MKLLTTGNPKLMKGEKKGYLSFVLHLAPADLSGYNVCPMASDGCRAACLNTAGRGGIFKPGTTTNAIQDARIRKTRWFFTDRYDFMLQLVKDVRLGIRQAEKQNLIPVFRLNGTSDIRWETVELSDGLQTFQNIMQMFPNVQFYDYTKLSNRRDLPSNYHLTFSRSESNDTAVASHLANGGNVAVVFNVKKGAALPESWNGFTVIDGDDTDLRFLDPQNVVVGLRGKGKATKGEHGGFVVNIQRRVA